MKFNGVSVAILRSDLLEYPEVSQNDVYLEQSEITIQILKQDVFPHHGIAEKVSESSQTSSPKIQLRPRL